MSKLNLENLSNYIFQFCSAISEEIAYLKNEGGKKYQIYNGKLIYSNSLIFAYTFETDVELYMPDSSPVRLKFNGRDYTGEILSCIEFEITIIIKEHLGKNIQKAEFICEPWKLLEELMKRLQELKYHPQFNRNMVYKLMCEGNRTAENNNKMKKGQEVAIISSLYNPITIVWGPPGTGKTHTLANIAIKHFIKGNRILIISHSNAAVDEAVLKIYELLNENELAIYKGELLRYGYPRKKELANKPELISNMLIMEKYPDLHQRKKELEAEKETLKSKEINNNRIFNIEIELQKIRKQIHSHENELIQNSKILATTISKATIDTEIYKNSNFDAVLLDEASMAYIPQICFAAALARKHFIFFGDFRQLSPIVQCNTSFVEKWLLRDIYEYLDIPDNLDKGISHPWMVLLEEQRRMHPMISGFVNSRIYSMNLCDHPNVKLERKSIIQKPPFQDYALALIDLTRTCNICAKSSDNSRYNLLSALVSFQTGLIALHNGQTNVGIITPYSTQSQLIRSMIKDLDINQDEISCSTVHQFQGSQKDVIIFDCVESYRQKSPGILLTTNKNSASLRLINVAVTRARGKFIVVSNLSYWNNKLALDNSLLRNLFYYIKEKGKSCSGNEFLDMCSNNLISENMKWYNGSQCFSQFLEDIKSSKKEILMDIPQGNVINEKEIADILYAARSRGVKVLVRSENPYKLTPQLSKLCHKNPFAWAPITIIDNCIIWYGVPVMNTSFISDNTALPITIWPVIRFTGKKTADTIASLLEMHKYRNSISESFTSDHIGFTSFIENCNIKCKLCGGKMVLRKGKSHFLGCSNYPSCRHTHLLDKSFVEAYILQNSLKCKKDGYPLIAALSKYGVFARCKNPVKSHCYDLDSI